MSQHTGIEWTDSTWNPWYGCHKVSPGCKFCYMFREQVRYGQDPNVVTRSKTKFTEPLKWKEPRRVFTCSWSDWLIEESDPWRQDAYDVIRATPHLTYQILTKRPERAYNRIPVPAFSNIWWGVSVENRKEKHRIELLHAMPAALRFLSLEPLLEDLGELDLRGIGWVIVGGESGPGARPIESAWVRSILDQCRAANIPFFFKQWGESLPALQNGPQVGGRVVVNSSDHLIRVGKKAAGALLDGSAYREFPTTHLTRS